MLPVVALVGRPNVGKSTLFNALTRARDALVADLEGVTRDRRYGIAETEAGRFMVVDTGGLTGRSDGIEALTEQQVRAAISESDLLVFMVDARAGLTVEDERIAAALRVTGKPVLVAANKVDGLDESVATADFYALGFEAVEGVAAAHRRGVAQLAEQIVDCLPDRATADDEESPPGIRIAIVGRPNVGKSTLVNRLLGEERVIAYDMPGTTRDSIEVPLQRDGRDFVLIDTAGVRRRSRVDEAVEKFSVIKAMQAIDSADIAILMLDAQDGVVEQDATLLGHILERGRAFVVAVNKWDGMAVEDREWVRSELDRRLNFVPYAEKVFIAAQHGSGLGELMAAVDKAYESSRQEFSTSRLTDVLVAAFEAHQPPMVQGRTAKLKYAHLGGHNPLRIVIHGNRVDAVPDSYKRYLANTFRRKLDLTGTPLRLDFRQGDNPFKGRRNELTTRQLAKRKRLKRFTKRRK